MAICKTGTKEARWHSRKLYNPEAQGRAPDGLDGLERFKSISVSIAPSCHRVKVLLLLLLLLLAGVFRLLRLRFPSCCSSRLSVHRYLSFILRADGLADSVRQCLMLQRAALLSSCLKVESVGSSKKITSTMNRRNCWRRFSILRHSSVRKWCAAERKVCERELTHAPVRWRSSWNHLSCLYDDFEIDYIGSSS